MDDTVPTRFNVPFADAAVAPYVHQVPEASQIGITNGAASLHDGFPPLNFATPGAGGVPPFGNDVNGILKQITQWIRFASCAGGPVPYDSTFSTGIGGYPKGAILADSAINGLCWWSTKNANTTDPATPAQTDWQPFLVAASGVTAGSYVRPAITVGADGKITAAANGTYPTRQTLTSGTAATYTTPAGVKRLNIRMVGGGGGGSGGSITASDGTATIFNSITAAPGKGSQGDGGGATSDTGTGSASFRTRGNPGNAATTTSGTFSPGGSGGGGPWGGAGQAGNTATAGATNSGAGGGGNSLPTKGGGGGGAAEYVELIVNNPAATYTYTVGAGGAGNGGGNGGSGVIIVDENYD